MPETKILETAVDTYSDSARPTKNFGDESRIRIGGASRNAFIYFTRPVPKGATVVSAKLRLRNRGVQSGAFSVIMARLSSTWRERRLTHNVQPTFGVETAAIPIANLAADALNEIEVTALVAEAAAGSPWFGLRMRTATAGPFAFHSAEASKNRLHPELVVQWAEAPEKATNPRPSGGRYVSDVDCTFLWDPNPDEAAVQQAFQLRIYDAASALVHDSGVVSSGDSKYDLSGVAYALPVGATNYKWEVRYQDSFGAWSPYTDQQTFSHEALGVLTMSSPGVSPNDFVEDDSPPVTTANSKAQDAIEDLLYRIADGDRELVKRRPRHVAVAAAAAAYTESVPSGFLEEAWTNFLTFAQAKNFSAGWTVNGLTISNDARVAPDGTMTMDGLIEDASNGYHRVYVNGGAKDGKPQTHSVWLQEGGRQWAGLGIQDGGVAAYFDLWNGIPGNIVGPPGSTSGMEPVPGMAGVWRCWFARPDGRAVADYMMVWPALANGGSYRYQGVVGLGIYAWHPLAEDSGILNPWGRGIYELERRSWDTRDREALPDAADFSVVSRQFIYRRGTSVTAVTAGSLVRTDDGTGPGVTIQFGRTTTPDEWVVRKDGKEAARFVGGDLFVTGTTYELTFYGCVPGVECALEVEPVVNGVHALNNPVLSVTLYTIGTWLVGTEDGIEVVFLEESIDDEIGESSELHILAGRRDPTLETQQIRGDEGTLSGLLMPYKGVSGTEYRDRLFALKETAGETEIRLISEDRNYPILMGPGTKVPKLGQYVDAFEGSVPFLQVGEFRLQGVPA